MTADLIARLEAALTERDDYLAKVGGCGNAHCIVYDPPGQHTNGGCKCSTDRMAMGRYAYANNRFADRVRALSKEGEPNG